MIPYEKDMLYHRETRANRLDEGMFPKVVDNLWAQDAYLKALHFAAGAHDGQYVPGTRQPYLVHVVSVAMEVISALRAEIVEAPDLAVQCALLHDVIEDTEISYGEIADRFGVAVADGVQALTKNAGLAKGDAMADSLARIQTQPVEIWLVKLADRITNLQPPPRDWTAEKCSRYRVEARQIHQALADASDYLSARLEQQIDSYGAYCG